MKASNPQKVKKNNLLYLAALIKEHGPLSKRELSERSGLSVVTINKLIPELLTKQMIEPYSTDVVTGGRYAVSYVFNEKKFYSLIIKLVEKQKEMYFYFYLTDVFGNIIEEKEASGTQMEWSDLLDIIGGWQERYPEIRSIILGIPGVEMSGVITLVDYPMLKGKSVKKELEERFDCLVQIENDVNAAILGFSNQEKSDLIIAGIYYPIGFPPGGGLSINQKLLKGKNNFAGEVAELPLRVNWKTIPQVDLKEHLLNVLISFISLYDPHKVVVYISKKQLENRDILEITKELEIRLPLIDLPELVVKEDFNQDYFLGLSKLGNDQLNLLLQQEIGIGE